MSTVARQDTVLGVQRIIGHAESTRWEAATFQNILGFSGVVILPLLHLPASESYPDPDVIDLSGIVGVQSDVTQTVAWEWSHAVWDQHPVHGTEAVASVPYSTFLRAVAELLQGEIPRLTKRPVQSDIRQRSHPEDENSQYLLLLVRVPPDTKTEDVLELEDRIVDKQLELYPETVGDVVVRVTRSRR